MRKVRGVCFCFALLLAWQLAVFAQSDSRSVIKPQTYVSATGVRAGDKFKIAVALQVDRGFHINSHSASQEDLIQTEIQFAPPPGIRIVDTKYPPGSLKTFAFSPDTPLSVYDGLIKIVGTAEAEPAIQPGSVDVTGKVTVQACTDTYCLSPSKFDVKIPVRVVEAGAPIEQTHVAMFSDLQQFAGSESQDELGNLIASSGLPLAFLTVFLAGLALNLTPCVYPIIPITIGFFVNQSAAQGKARLSRTLLMATMYVIGMAITYSLLGVVASMTGGLFGATLQNPIVLIGIAGVMVVLSLSMFGVYEFRIPQFLNRFANKSAGSTGGLAGAFVMGLTMGIVAAPCIGPFVVGLLVHVSTKGDPIYGFFLFFVLALGQGLPYVLLGTFSGSLKELPRSGEWMVAVRKVFGLVLLGMALYFLMPLMGTYKTGIMVVSFAAASLYLIFWEAARTRPKAFAWILRAIGVAAAVAGAIMMLPAKEGIPWQPYTEQSLAAAQKEGRPVVIDVFADWCIPCKELDQLTFTHDEVKKEASRFLALKLDLTSLDPDAEAARAKERFQIKGVPTIVFLNADGNEHANLKLTGFEKAAPFLERMKRVPRE